MRLLFVTLVTLSFAACSTAFLQSLLGLGSSKDLCPIKLYDVKDASFAGMKLYGNEKTFHPLLLTLSKYARECRVRIQIKQSFIQENAGLTTLKMHDHAEMAFRLGEAIEFELLDRDDKLLCNRLCLQKDISQLRALPDAKCFLEKVAKNTDFRQDAVKPTILIKRPRSGESLAEQEKQRKDIQQKCAKLKMNV